MPMRGAMAEGPYLNVRFRLNGGQLEMDADGNLPPPFIFQGLEMLRIKAVGLLNLHDRGGRTTAPTGINARKVDAPARD